MNSFSRACFCATISVLPFSRTTINIRLSTIIPPIENNFSENVDTEGMIIGIWFNQSRKPMLAIMWLHCKLHIIIILKRNIGLSKYESASATYTFTNTQCCQSTIRNLVYKFVCRLNKSDNALIRALLASSVAYSSRIRSHWRRLLMYTAHRSHWLVSSYILYTM